MKHHALGLDGTIFMKASGSREHVNYLGPQNAFRTISLILRIEKRNQLSETSKRSKGYTINQKVPQIFKILISMDFFVPLETELSWNVERRGNVF